MQWLMMLLSALGTCLSLLTAAAAMTGADPAQLDTPSLLLSHRRQKRAWIWNQMHIQEEQNSSLPHYVGKVRHSPWDDQNQLQWPKDGDTSCGSCGRKMMFLEGKWQCWQ